LSEIERKELESIAASHALSHGLVRRDQMILASAPGKTNSSIAKRHNVSVPTVNHWHSGFLEQSLVGSYGENRQRRPRNHDDEEVMMLLR
jgi:transposase